MARDVVAEIRRATRRKFRAEDKIRIVLEGLRGEIPVSHLCRREGISPALYYQWSKSLLEAGKNGLTVDTKRDATKGEVHRLREENEALNTDHPSSKTSLYHVRFILAPGRKSWQARVTRTARL